VQGDYTNRSQNDYVKKYNNMKCINCRQYGHSYRDCRCPKISCGILAIKIDKEIAGTNWKKYSETLANYMSCVESVSSNEQIICQNEEMLKKVISLKESIKFLLIMRKHTIGYMDFIRGNYDINSYIQISYLFEQMTPKEIQLITDNINNFDYMWDILWSPYSPVLETPVKSPTLNETSPTEKGDDISNCSQDDKPKRCYRGERTYEFAKQKFNSLLTNPVMSLAEYIKRTKTQYDTPEWGFPKGRRSGNEVDLECAKREFTEETGYTENDYILFDNIKPLVEDIIGSNGIKYRHIYYIALLKSDRIPSCTGLTNSQMCEIGDIGLFDFDNAYNKIRPHHVIRKEIITLMCSQIINCIINNT